MFVTATPSLSFDGQYLAYAAPCSGHGDIYLLKSGTTMPLRLTTSDDFEASPIFTIDDKQIVYVREQNQRRHLWIMNADGSGQIQLTTGNVFDDPMTLSSDGRYLIFNRGAPSFGMGTQAHAYVMRIDKPNTELISAGNLAIFSRDSQYVVFSEADKIWRLELDGNGSKPRQLRGRGIPTDISEDGKWILTARLPVATTGIPEYAIWALNTDTNDEVCIGKGGSAIFIGKHSERVLLSANRLLIVTDVHGGTPTSVGSESTYKTNPRPVFGSRGAIVAEFPQVSSSDCNVLFINSEVAKAIKIATLGCGDTSFKFSANIKPNM